MASDDVAHDVLPQRRPRERKRRVRDEEDENGGDARAASGLERERGSSGAHRARDEDDVRGFESGDARVIRYAGADSLGGGTPSSADTGADEDEDETRARRGVKYAYKDHTADIQIHAWGEDLAEAYAWSALGMFDYMTPLEDCVSAPTTRYKEIRASGHDLDTLLFAFLDELLFTFHTEMLICTAVQVCEFDRDEWTIRAIVAGTTFVEGETRQGTEIKAITYSAMKIVERRNLSDAEVASGTHRAELFVIVDI